MADPRPLSINARLRAAGWKHCPVCYVPMPGAELEAHQEAAHGPNVITPAARNEQFIAKAIEAQERRRWKTNHFPTLRRGH